MTQIVVVGVYAYSAVERRRVPRLASRIRRSAATDSRKRWRLALFLELDDGRLVIGEPEGGWEYEIQPLDRDPPANQAARWPELVEAYVLRSRDRARDKAMWWGPLLTECNRVGLSVTLQQLEDLPLTVRYPTQMPEC